MMGSAADEVKEVTILGRKLKWTEEGIELWADDGHREKLMAAHELEEDSKPVEHPISSGGAENPEGEEPSERPTGV